MQGNQPCIYFSLINKEIIMALAKGVNKRTAYKKKTTWGTLAGASGAKLSSSM